MYQPSKQTIAMLEDIERRIDPETEEDFQNQWRDFLYDRFDGEIITPVRKKHSQPSFTYPKININDAIADYDLMLQSQLCGTSYALTRSDNLCIRTNYGTGILSSLFGAEIFVMPYEMNTLPTTRSLNDTEKIRAIVEKAGAEDLLKLQKALDERVAESFPVVTQLGGNFGDREIVESGFMI
jgi:hypothetical protein